MVGLQDNVDSSAKLLEFYKNVEYIVSEFYRILEYLGDDLEEWAEVLSALKDPLPLF